MRPNFVGAAQVENPLLNLRLHASRAMARAARTVQQSLHATFTETTYPLVSRGTRDTHGLRCGSGCPAGSHPLHKELPAIWSKARSTIQLRALHVPDLHNPDRARGLSLCQQGPWELHLDQPEDHLDAPYIATALVGHLELAKERRQVILATHSPNLTVLGDAELVIPMYADAGRGSPRDPGAVDRPET